MPMVVCQTCCELYLLELCVTGMKGEVSHVTEILLSRGYAYAINVF